MPRMSIPRSLCLSVTADFAGEKTSPDKRLLIRAEVKRLVALAIETGLPPIIVPDVERETGISENMSFPMRIDRAIRMSQESNPEVSYGNIAKGFVLAALLRETNSSDGTEKDDNDTLSRHCAALGFGCVRPAQRSFFANLSDSLSGKVGMVEGATGIGKTMAIITAAVEQVEKTGENVVITVPSLLLVSDFTKTHRALEKAGALLVNAVPIVGRQEFVSAGATLDALENPLAMEHCSKQDIDNILEWIDQDGPVRGEHAEVMGHRFLASSLAETAPLFPVDLVRLGQYNQKTEDGADDPGKVSYLRQFRDESGDPTRGIIYCTHAAIAMDIRRRKTFSRNSDATDFKTRIGEMYRNAKGLKKDGAAEASNEIHATIADYAQLAVNDDAGHVPKYRALVVDEAHLLEANIANALCDSVSLLAFVNLLRKLAAKKIVSIAKVKKVAEAVRELSEIGRNPDSDDSVDLSVKGDGIAEVVRGLLRKMVSDIDISTKKKKTLSASQMSTFNGMVKTIKDAATDDTVDAIRRTISFSTVRHYPSLSVGRKSVAQELSYLWGLADRGAACVSATLYFAKNSGIASAASYRALLNIPAARAAEYRPVRPGWVTEPVLGLWTPYQEKASDRWLYPHTSHRKSTNARDISSKTESEWLDELGLVGGEIYRTAEGGVLFLCTAYATTQGLAERLHETIGDECMVVARRGIPLAAQRAEFFKKSETGRVLWLAVGAAWTGLNVENKSNPNLLTDLVIPRLPFKQNRTTTHESRVAQNGGWSGELLSAVMFYRQGIGRLVRQSGLPRNRRIFVLDGRINDANFAGNAAVFKNENAAYPAKMLTKNGSIL